MFFCMFWGLFLVIFDDFWWFFENKKDARRPYDHFPLSFAPRSLLCVRKRRFPFLKPRCFCAAKMLFWGNRAAEAGGTGRRRWGNQPPGLHQPIPLRNSKNPKGKPGWGTMSFILALTDTVPPEASGLQNRTQDSPREAQTYLESISHNTSRD